MKHQTQQPEQGLRCHTSTQTTPEDLDAVVGIPRDLHAATQHPERRTHSYSNTQTVSRAAYTWLHQPQDSHAHSCPTLTDAHGPSRSWMLPCTVRQDLQTPLTPIQHRGRSAAGERHCHVRAQRPSGAMSCAHRVRPSPSHTAPQHTHSHASIQGRTGQTVPTPRQTRYRHSRTSTWRPEWTVCQQLEMCSGSPQHPDLT